LALDITAFVRGSRSGVTEYITWLSGAVREAAAMENHRIMREDLAFRDSGAPVVRIGLQSLEEKSARQGFQRLPQIEDRPAVAGNPMIFEIPHEPVVSVARLPPSRSE